MRTLLIAVMLFSSQAFAWTYNVTPPVDKTQCPAGPWMTQAFGTSGNCGYTILGYYTDSYVFDVWAEAVYTFETKGSSLHNYQASGRAHQSYTTSNVMTNAYVSDSNGNLILQLVDTPYWSHIECTKPFQSQCSKHLTDDWSGAIDLLPGQYTLTVTGVVSGNRPGVYSVSIQPPPPPPVQLPLAPLTLAGTVSCDLSTVTCILSPADTSAVTTVTFDLTNSVARLVPAIADPYTGPLTLELVGTNDDGSGTQTALIFSFAGQAVITDNISTLTVVFSFDEQIDLTTGVVTFTNWQVSTQ